MMRKPYIAPISPLCFIVPFEHARLSDGFYENEKGELRHWINCGCRTGGYLADRDKWLLAALERKP